MGADEPGCESPLTVRRQKQFLHHALHGDCAWVHATSGVIGRLPNTINRLRPHDIGDPRTMFTERFLRDKRGVALTSEEREILENAISEVKTFGPRTTLALAGEPLSHSTLLIEGIMSRHIDDRNGLRQLVALHVAGDFVDLHAYPLKILDHDVGTMTAVTVAMVPHKRLDAIVSEWPDLARKLWFSTLLDAAIHRAWLFRLGRLDAVGRVAHFFCEMNMRLAAAGLSDGRRFALGLTQADLGEICGLTPVHINRVMRQLREDELCVFRSSLVEILSPVRLVERAQFDPDYLYLSEPLSGFPSPRTRPD